jgi:Cytochrome c oxidase subunit IV
MSADHGPRADHGPEISERAGLETAGHGHHVELPGPSIWPVILAGGITLLCAGVVLGSVVGLVGLVALVLALGGWIQEMRHGH